MKWYEMTKKWIVKLGQVDSTWSKSLLLVDLSESCQTMQCMQMT